MYIYILLINNVPNNTCYKYASSSTLKNNCLKSSINLNFSFEIVFACLSLQFNKWIYDRNIVMVPFCNLFSYIKCEILRIIVYSLVYSNISQLIIIWSVVKQEDHNIS